MISEKIFEDIICKYPELIEKGLKLIGRQITLYRGRMDIVFEDEFNRKLIVELKAGPIKDKHIGQLLRYEGMLLSSDDPTLRVMLIGTRVPPNIQRSLDHHGIAWKEISNLKLKEFIQTAGDGDYLEYFDSVDVGDRWRNQATKSMIRSTVEQSRLDRRAPISGAATFEELCNTIRHRSATIPTNYMDLLLLENEHKSLSRILAQWQNHHKGKTRDFRTISILRAHIRYREKNDGWIFIRSGNEEDPIVKLTGLTGSRGKARSSS